MIRANLRGTVGITLALLAISVHATVAQLDKRNPYYGGFAMPEMNGCPANTETYDSGFCCPLGTWCGPNINGPYCCPTRDDCGVKVQDLPTCADPSLVMYEDAYFYCCPSDMNGIVFGQCQPKDLTFSANQYATTTKQANSVTPPAPGATAPTTSVPAGTTPTGAGQTSGPKTPAQTGSANKMVSGIFGLGALAVVAAL